MERRYAGVELRAEGRTLTGPAIRYGDVSPSHRERFEPGAFDLDDRTRWLDVGHDRERVVAWTNGGGLELTDTREALMVRASLPEIPLADRALADVQAGRLRGFSVEFNALSESRESGIRVVEKAELSGIGVVRSPSYPQSAVEIRARSGRTIRARIPTNQLLACRCAGAGCRMAEINEGMEKMLRDVWDEFGVWAEGQREAVAGFGSYSDAPLASASSRTLRGRMLRNGDAQIDIDLPDSPLGAATIAAHEAAGVIVRPHLDAESVGEMRGDTMHYTRPVLRGILVSATDAREGWPEPEIVSTPDDIMERAERRRRVWL